MNNFSIKPAWKLLLLCFIFFPLTVIPSFAGDERTAITPYPGRVEKHLLCKSSPSCRLQFSYPVFYGTDDCTALNEAIKSLVCDRVDKVFPEQANDPAGWTIDGSFHVRCVNAEFVSIAFYVKSYFGGNHALTDNFSFNWDRHSQEEVTLESVFGGSVDYGALAKLTRAKLLDSFAGRDESMIFEGTEPRAENFACWYLENQGLTVQFSQYQIGQYSDGMPEVALSYGEIRHLCGTQSIVSRRALTAKR